MSHITNIDLEIKDLNALQSACRRMGLTFNHGAGKVRFYKSQSVDADHVINVPGCSYDVGVVSNKTGGFSLVWDNYQTGGLEAILGAGAGKLKQAYGIEKAKIEARKKGYSVVEAKKSDGSITLTIEGGF